MDFLAPPRPDRSPPENLDDAQLGLAIDSLARKLRSVRASLRKARLAGVAALVVIMATGFTLLWAGPEPFLPRIFENGDAVTVPELLAWWGVVIAAAMFVGTVSHRLLARRMRVVHGWEHKARELERRLSHAKAEATRRSAP